MSEERLVQRWDRIEGGTTSVADLLDYCAHHDLDPAVVQISGGHLKWQTPETSEERERREAAQRAVDERQEKWEREALVRFTEKYGPAPSAASGTDEGSEQ